MNKSKCQEVNINGVDIKWDTQEGTLDFFGISSTLFWNDPSLLHLFKPLVHELGKDLFQLLVAYSSSQGTEEDYHAMITHFASDFKEGFLKWGSAVSGAGWGKFELRDIDFSAKTARVIIHRPWELNMQASISEKERWGCPFLQGKLIGIFSHAFEGTCWADESYDYVDGDGLVEFRIYSSNMTIEDELNALRLSVEDDKLRELRLAVNKQTKKIKDQQKMYEVIFKNAVDGVLILENGIFTQCNPSAMEMLLYKDKKQIIGKKPEDISPKFQPDGQLSKDKAIAILERVTEDEGAKFEWVHTRSDGEELWIEIVLTPINYSDKDIVHVVWRDIQDRKEEQARLEYLNQNLQNEVQLKVESIREKEAMLLEQAKLAAMGEMIGNIAHQWRQPLNNLALINQDMYFKLLLGEPDMEEFEKAQALINDNIQFMSATIDNFRNFFNPDKDKVDFTMEEAIEQTLQILDATFKSHFITSDFKSGSHTLINNHFGELEQVLIILFQNAKDMLVEKKIADARINIVTQEENENVIVTIEDNAGGVPKKIIHKIFEPYFTTKFQSKGTGLGLYIAKMIIEKNMGGSLSVHNTDKGALFKIVLPIRGEI